MRRASFLSQQWRIIHALIVREIYTRFGRENLGFAWIVVEPTIFCLAVIAMWTLAIGKHSHVEIPLIEFLLTGYMPLLMYRHSVNRLQRCMQANAELLYHRNITILSMYVARLFVEIVGTVGAFVITAAVFVLWGLASPPHDIPMVLAGFGLYAAFTVGVAITVGSLSERSELVEKIWNPLSYVTIPFSGAFYMLYWMPDSARRVLVYFPPVSAVETIRGGYFGPDTPIFAEPEITLAVSGVILAIGLMLLRNARKYVETA